MKSLGKSRIFFLFELLLLGSIVFVVLFPYNPKIQTFPSRDSGVFLYTGWRVSQGEIPYLQVWDHKPPVIYYINALGLSLTPGQTLGVWLMEVVSLMAAAIFCYILLKQIFSLETAIFGSFLWLFTSYYLMAGGNLTTEYALPFQLVIIWLFYKAEKQRVYDWYGFLIGLLTSVLFFTRQNAIAIPCAVGIYLFLNRILRKDIKSLSQNGLVVLLGGLLGIGIFAGYFALKGALPAFWDTAFLYNFSYVDERTGMDRINALLQGLNQLENLGLAQISFAGWSAALVFLLFKKNQLKIECRPVLWMCILALPLELWMVSLGGRPRIPYFLTLLPVMTVLAGFSLWLIFEGVAKDVPKYATAGMLVVMIISIWSVFYADYSEILNQNISPSGNLKLISYIKGHSDLQDYVLMWGAETEYNFVTRRTSPSRFVYQTPLYNLSDQNKVTEFLKDVNTNQPRLIILRAEDRLSDFRFAYRDDQIGLLMDQIKVNYKNKVKLDDWVIYSYSGN